MSGFDKAWLDLRERADDSARDAALLSQIPLAAGKEFRVLDLGAGTGSNLRYLAPRLNALRVPPQCWTLVDDDPGLLEAVAFAPSNLHVQKMHLDLARHLPDLNAIRPALVTASAFFDLVSEAWLVRFAATCAAACVPAGLFALNVDERMTWDPYDPMDDEITMSFHRHMQRDKGFGKALGPRGPGKLEQAFGEVGFTVRSGDSAWRLLPSDADMQRALLKFYISAAIETTPAEAPLVSAWAARRERHIADGKSRLTVGHRDVLVLWDGRFG